jgi:hypothetical protein
MMRKFLKQSEAYEKARIAVGGQQGAERAGRACSSIIQFRKAEWHIGWKKG